jgi:hypothetical protein
MNLERFQGRYVIVIGLRIESEVASTDVKG